MADVVTRIGSLCSGYEGLGMAVQEVLGGELAWVADNDEGAAAILAHRFPSVKNLGDITVADWGAAGPVDVLTAGFPCQDVSCAGGRAGLREGNRTGVWAHVARAIDELRPSLVVLENVRGLLSAGADSDVESCPWCLGESGMEHALRACGAVLGDLADLGYDARWAVVSAADAGAPHRRERVFILGWPAADAGDGLLAAHRGGVAGRTPGGEWGDPGPDRRPGDRGNPAAEDADGAAGGERRLAAPGQAAGGRPRADAGGPGGVRAAADTAGYGRDEGRPEPAGVVGGPDAALGGDGPAADAPGVRYGDAGPAGERGVPAAAVSGAPADPGGSRLGQHPGEPFAQESGPLTGDEPSGDRGLRPAAEWGPYESAVRRWEAVTGRPAPPPTEPGRTGQRLSPAFVEWLMGLPGGWVTDVPGLSRNAQLKALGNGVVPQQAAMALRLLLPGWMEAAA